MEESSREIRKKEEIEMRNSTDFQKSMTRSALSIRANEETYWRHVAGLKYAVGYPVSGEQIASAKKLQDIRLNGVGFILQVDAVLNRSGISTEEAFKDDVDATHFLCTLVREDSPVTYTFFYSQGGGHKWKWPRIAAVLDAVFCDALSGTDEFLFFCENMGITDIQKLDEAKAQWQECKKVLYFFTLVGLELDDLQSLYNAVTDYVDPVSQLMLHRIEKSNTAVG